jgi:hypothetical protein
MVILDGKFVLGCGPVNTYISIYARTNRCYNERGSRTKYVRSSIPHCILYRSPKGEGSFKNSRFCVSQLNMMWKLENRTDVRIT